MRNKKGEAGRGLRVGRSGFKKDERRTSNVQHRTSNECILSILKMTERSDSILRYSLFVIRYSLFVIRYSLFVIRYSIFCGSLVIK